MRNQRPAFLGQTWYKYMYLSLYSISLCVYTCKYFSTQRVQCVRLERHSASATASVLQSATCLPLSRGSVQPAPLAVSVPLTCTSLETSVCPRTAALTLSLVGSYLFLYPLSISVCISYIHVHDMYLSPTCPDKIPVVDKCSQYEDCSECISSDPDCQWCPYLPVCYSLAHITVELLYSAYL